MLLGQHGRALRTQRVEAHHALAVRLGDVRVPRRPRRRRSSNRVFGRSDADSGAGREGWRRTRWYPRLTTGGMVLELDIVPNPTLKPRSIRCDCSSGRGSESAAPETLGWYDASSSRGEMCRFRCAVAGQSLATRKHLRAASCCCDEKRRHGSSPMKSLLSQPRYPL